MILNMPGKRPENLKELLRYMNQLEEQLRFILGNIDGSDITQGTITADKIAPGAGNALDISSNEAIIMKVSKGEAVDSVKNSAMTLDSKGIEMETTGYFRLYADNGKDSSIKLGGDEEEGANFSVNQEGNVGAVSGAFANGLTVGGHDVWSKGNIIYSESEPQGVQNVIWIQPTQGTGQVIHGVTNGSQAYWDSGHNYGYTLEPKSAGVLSSATGCSYTLTLQMGRGGSGKGLKGFRMEAVLSTSAGSVTLQSERFTLGDWGNAQVTLTGSSEVNLFAASESVNVAIKAIADDTGNTYLYVKKDTEILLTSKNMTAARGAQACNIYYIT